MGRKWLPSLRGTSGGVPLGYEGKMHPAMLGGPLNVQLQSVTSARSNRMGMEDRAAGWNIDAVITDGYERNVWVYNCVEWIAANQSRLKFRFGREMETDDQEILDEHPLYRLLNKKANPLETGRNFRKRLSQQILLCKRGAFVEVTRSRMGTLTRLDLLPPSRVMPIPSETGDYLDYFEYTTWDGRLVELAPEKVLWFRDPHPTDPFCGTTPLEAAGISVELDFLSRWYNVNFIRNDGRPSGILGVDADGLDDRMLALIERQMLHGPDNAGKTAVIGTGPGGMKYVDTSTKPRDMAYGEASQNAKTEVLSAFRLDESVVGAVAERTYDNAEQALFNAWTGPMQQHLDLISSVFDPEVDDEWDAFFDTTGVEVLELPRRKRREEARQEWNAGLRSLDEYRRASDLPELNNAYSRALWISPSKAPVPFRPEDAAELGVGGTQVGPDGQPIPPTGPGGPGGPTATDVVAQARAEGGVDDRDAAAATGSTLAGAAGSVASARAANANASVPGDAAGIVSSARATETKAAQPQRAPKPKAPRSVEHDPGEDLQRRTEIATAAAVDVLLARQAGVISSRIKSPKMRKGTAFWTPAADEGTQAAIAAGVGAAAAEEPAPLDVEKVVNAEQWVQATAEALAPIIAGAAAQAGADLLTTLGGGATVIVSGAAAATTATAAATDAAAKVMAAALTAPAALEVLTVAEAMMTANLTDLADALNAATLAEGADVDSLLAAVKDHYAQVSRPFANKVASAVGYAAVNAGLEATAAGLTGLPDAGGEVPEILRTWRTRDDDRVRPAHREVDKRTEVAPNPFMVGGFMLRYPGDPAAPLHLTAGCRCRLTYTVVSTDRFVGVADGGPLNGVASGPIPGQIPLIPTPA